MSHPRIKSESLRCGYPDWTWWSRPLPDDVFRMAEGSPALQEQLERAPVTYLLERTRAYSALGAVDVEAQLLRTLRVVGNRPFTLTGTLSAESDVLADGGDSCVDVGIEVDRQTVLVRSAALGPRPSKRAHR